MKKEDKIEILSCAIDQLEQYDHYSESMRKHGRGFNPSSPFSTSHIVKLLQAIINLEKDDSEKGIKDFIDNLKTNLGEG